MITDFKGISVHYEIKGEGEPIVFLHGFLEDSFLWKELTDHFSDFFCTVTIDLPGHGRSSTSKEGIHTMEFMAEAVAEVLKESSIDQATLVGHSMGGYVALAFAEQYPHQLKKLGLIHSSCYADGNEKQKNRERVIKLLQTRPEIFIRESLPLLFAPFNRKKLHQEVDKLVAQGLQMSVEGLIACTRGMKIRKDRTSVLRDIKVPSLMIAGEFDPVVPPEDSRQQMSMNPLIKGDILAESGHMGIFEEPEKVKMLLKKFLAEP